jgi:hypothetical protein
MMRYRIFFLLFIVGLSVGCATNRSTASIPGGNSEGLVFSLSDTQADKILASSMVALFPGSAISRVEIPNKGYQVLIRFLLDYHTIIATMTPAYGRSPSGEEQRGYVFGVNDHGTMYLSGRARAKQLFKHIVHSAELTTQPMPFVRLDP